MRKLDPPLPLGQLAGHLGIEVEAHFAGRPIERLASLSSAGAQDLSFLSDARYVQQAEQSGAAAILVHDDNASRVVPPVVALVVPDPYLAFARLSMVFQAQLADTPAETAAQPIHPSATVAPAAIIGAGAQIGPNCVINDHALVGTNVRIGANCVVGPRVRIGADSRLHDNVTIYRDSELGAACTVQAGTVIGSDGFGYARDRDHWQKIAQLGAVHIGDRVEIGANCTIDRGALDDTIIGDDCILDNLIQVAHNVRIGAGTALAACVGIAGSAKIGQNCLIGGGAGILGHLEVVDGVVLSPMSLVTRSLRKPGFYSGSFPLMENAQWEKAAAALRRLPDLRSRLRHIEQLTGKPQ